MNSNLRQNKMGDNLNQTMPIMTSSPGFNPFFNPSDMMRKNMPSMESYNYGGNKSYFANPMNSFNGAMSYASYLKPQPMTAAYPTTPNGVLESTSNTGRLKFFDEVQNYGFLVVDGEDYDLFVHYDDLKTSKLSRDILRQAKTNYFLQFSFDIVRYTGKYKESKKAVNLKLIKFEKLGLIN